MKNLFERAKGIFTRKKKNDNEYNSEIAPKPANMADGDDYDADNRYMDDAASMGSYNVAENDKIRSMRSDSPKPNITISQSNPYIPSATKPPGSAGLPSNSNLPSGISQNNSAFSKLPSSPLHKTTGQYEATNASTVFDNSTSGFKANSSVNSNSTVGRQSTGFHSAVISNKNQPSVNDIRTGGVPSIKQDPVVVNNRPSSVSNQSNLGDNTSRIEVAYPIENILVDANIPSSVAIKINDAVEKDRLGNAFRVHRYTYEPDAQNFTFNTRNEQLVRHRDDPSRPVGTRHIREVPLNDQFVPVFGPSSRSNNRYQGRTLNDYVDDIVRTHDQLLTFGNNVNQFQIQHNSVLQTANINSGYPSTNNQVCVDEPVFYYTARALNYDPMRIA